MYEVNVKDYGKNFLGKLEAVASYQKSTFYILRSRLHRRGRSSDHGA
jgi:hypothetical protein